MQQITDFFNHPFFVVFGGISTLLVIAVAIGGVYLAVKGILPVWYRLGFSLSKRKIAIFADEKYDELREMLVDSGVFKERNIQKVSRNAIKKVEDVSFYIVHYDSYAEEMDAIIGMKKDTDVMIIYAPQKEGFIEKTVMEKINSERNSIVVNVRGRLLNDALVSMITTGFR